MTDILERLQEESLRLARHSFDSVDAGLAANVADAAIDEIQKLREALQEAERFMAYFSGETNGHFVGPGMPRECLAQIRTALSQAERE